MKTTEQILTEQVTSGRSPSVQYFFFDQDSILDSHQMGYAKISERQKAEINTTYHAFSVTKTFTAVAVLQLAEKELIDIDGPVIDYVTNFPFGNEIKVRNLLSHSAGLPNPIPLSWIHLAGEHDSFDYHVFFEKIFAKNTKLKSKPNDKFAYSNLGYVILGQLIERISGKSYENCITEHILNKLPLGENDLAFEILDDNRHARGYLKKRSLTNVMLGFLLDKSRFIDKTEGNWKSFRNYYVNGPSYGGLIGKPVAFVKYVQALIKDDNGLITKDSKQLMFQENHNSKGQKTGMCLSWFTGQLNGHPYFAHAGGGGGYYCEIRLYPGLKLGSVVFFNRTGMRDERFLDKLDITYISK
jgi:CubicO group peptidase (beta-lactamase class C family)